MPVQLFPRILRLLATYVQNNASSLQLVLVLARVGGIQNRHLKGRVEITRIVEEEALYLVVQSIDLVDSTFCMNSRIIIEMQSELQPFPLLRVSRKIRERRQG